MVTQRPVQLRRWTVAMTRVLVRSDKRTMRLRAPVRTIWARPTAAAAGLVLCGSGLPIANIREVGALVPCAVMVRMSAR